MKVLRIQAVIWLSSVLAFAALSGPAKAEDQIVTATVSGATVGDIIVTIKTSDAGAATHSCTTSGTSGCTVTDEETSIPKNMANMLCLPQSMGGYTIDSACRSLLLQGSSDCQNNYADPICDQKDYPYNTTYSYVAPLCNFRTSTTPSVSANWSWVLERNQAGVTVKCSQTGYQGASPP
jgi:hypothetical protein